MNDHDLELMRSDELSPAGRARREAMLAQLHTAMAGRRRRKTARRTGLTAAAFLTAGASALALLVPQPPAPAQLGPISIGRPAARVRIVTTDQSITERLGISAATPRLVRVISDEELLALSAADGTTYGLIRTAQGARLIANSRSPAPEQSQ